jgi:hypothetical protein
MAGVTIKKEIRRKGIQKVIIQPQHIADLRQSFKFQ